VDIVEQVVLVVLGQVRIVQDLDRGRVARDARVFRSNVDQVLLREISALVLRDLLFPPPVLLVVVIARADLLPRIAGQRLGVGAVDIVGIFLGPLLGGLLWIAGFLDGADRAVFDDLSLGLVGDLGTDARSIHS